MHGMLRFVVYMGLYGTHLDGDCNEALNKDPH